MPKSVYNDGRQGKYTRATVYRTVQYMPVIQKLKRLRKPQINLKVSCIIHNYYFSTFLHKNSRLYLFGTHQIAHKSAANDSQCQAIELWWTDAYQTHVTDSQFNRHRDFLVTLYKSAVDSQHDTTHSCSPHARSYQL